jgi:hypothetical protein
MIGPILLAIAAAASTPAQPIPQASPPVQAPAIEIRFDYSNADATLAALASPDKASLDALMALPSTAAVIEKLHRRNSGVTPAVYESSLDQARRGEKLQADPFQWQFAIAEQSRMRSLLWQLHQMEPAIKDRVAKALAPNMPPGLSVSATVHFIIGGMSAGWEEGASSFYIGLPFYHGDLEGVILTMQHEIFHNVEYIGFHDQERDLARLAPREQEVYRFLDELYREGAATYAENLGSFPPSAPHVAEEFAPALVNTGRMGDDFMLLDTILYRLSRDPASHFADIRSLGFDWDWQNPMYFLGAYMTKYLAAQGKSLRDYVRQRPTAFARDYVELCRRNHCRMSLSEGEADEIVRIDHKLAGEGTGSGQAAH